MTAIAPGTQVDQDDLNTLLDEGVERAIARERSAFDAVAGKLGQNIVLFGAGNLGRRTLRKLRGLGIEPLALLDNDSTRWGTTLEGVPLLSPAEGARRYASSAVFVVTVWGALGQDRMRARIDQLRGLGCLRVCSFVPLYWKFAEALLPYYAITLPHLLHQAAEEVRETLRLWADDASRHEYLAQLRWRLSGDFDCLPAPVGHTIYFPSDLCSLTKDEVFVDCGAFDGDTVLAFLDKSQAKFKRIVAIEADPVNFQLLEENLSRLQNEVRSRIQLIAAATSDENGRLCIASGNGVASAIGEGDCEVDAITLDSALSDNAATYLKMDIEGSEIATLMGAAQQIREHTPVLAVCAYHRQSDLWKIPLLIQSIQPDYSFFLRPHLFGVWDLVCYAIPRKRLRRNS